MRSIIFINVNDFGSTNNNDFSLRSVDNFFVVGIAYRKLATYNAACRGARSATELAPNLKRGEAHASSGSINSSFKTYTLRVAAKYSRTSDMLGEFDWSSLSFMPYPLRLLACSSE